MRRFVLPSGFAGGGPGVLKGKDARYLSRVLRLKPGDFIEAIDSAGGRWTLSLQPRKPGDSEDDLRYVARHLSEAENRGAGENGEVQVLPGRGGEAGLSSGHARQFLPGRDILADTEITLFQCLPKGAKMDDIVRQAAEQGVRRIVPVESERSVPRLGGEDGGSAKKMERWRRIVKEARQQSGSLVNTEILEPLGMKDVPACWRKAGPFLFFHEVPLAETGLHRYLEASPAKLALIVGPEGGLSDGETAFLQADGCLPVNLGSTVLRVDTAAACAIAAIRIILLERQSWSLTRTSRPNA